MTEQRQRRNLIWPIYGVLVIAGFIISSGVGVAILIVGAVIAGMLWSGLHRGGAAAGPPMSERAQARSAARTEKRAHRRR